MKTGGHFRQKNDREMCKATNVFYLFKWFLYLLGYGDISAVSPEERLFAVVAMIIGAASFSFGNQILLGYFFLFSFIFYIKEFQTSPFYSDFFWFETQFLCCLIIISLSFLCLCKHSQRYFKKSSLYYYYLVHVTIVYDSLYFSLWYFYKFYYKFISLQSSVILLSLFLFLFFFLALKT